ncbi:MAG TPA: hypothetical protein VHI13_14540 [Candidatus Kapabacteria bacterium]|nr:hypothetical protein [Candidatus Kapabacteria bacterium]
MKLRLLALSCFMLIAALAVGEAKTTYHIGDGGKLDWNRRTDEGCTCWSGGSNCYVTLSMAVTNVRDGGNVWLVSGKIESLFADIDIAPGELFHKDMPFVNYTFPAGWFDVADGEFQGVPATRINLAGVVTLADGSFNASVPK